QEAVWRTQEIAELVRSDRVAEAKVRTLLAGLFAMQHRFGEADELIASSVAVLEELDVAVSLGQNRRIAADVHLHAGRPDAAEQELHLAQATLHRVGDRAGIVSAAIDLADLLCAQGRYADAEAQLASARGVFDRSDVMTRVTGLVVEAKLLGQAGALVNANAVARTAVELGEATDALTTRGRVWLALSEILQLEGKRDEARAAGAKALERFVAKGDQTGAARAGVLLSLAAPTLARRPAAPIEAEALDHLIVDAPL